MTYDFAYPHKTSYEVIAQTDMFLLLAGGCEEQDSLIYTCADWVIHDLHTKGYELAQKPVYFIDCTEGAVEITHTDGEYERYRFCGKAQSDFLHQIAMQHPRYRQHAEAQN